MRPSLWILSTGTELSSGRSRDTNSAEIARRFADRGWTVKGISVLPDDPDVLVSYLRWLGAQEAPGTGSQAPSPAQERTEVGAGVAAIVMTGGLGPTEDDFTIDVLSRITGSEIIEDPAALHRLKTFLRLKPIITLETARRQVRVLKDGQVIPNGTGLAPGVLVALKGHGGTPGPWLAALPGVPSEMRPMLDDVVHRLDDTFRTAPAFRREFHIYEDAESEFQRITFGDPSEPQGRGLADPALHGDPAFHWGVAALPGAIKVFLEHETAEAGIDRLAGDIAAHYGERFLSAPVEELLPRLLLERGWSLCLAESCTGGLISKILTDRPGSSAYFAGAAVTYANTAKTRLLGVDDEILSLHGAVSAECARAMAQGALHLFGASASLAVTGIAGPDGGSPEKPVGTVHIAGCYRDETFHHRLFFPLDRDRVREYTARAALFHLFRFLSSRAP